MSNPSTIWAALSLPLSPVGEVPFVGLDGVSIAADAANFNYAQSGAQLAGTQRTKQLTVAGGIRTDILDVTNIVNIAVTCNAVCGRVNMPGGASTVTVTNTFVAEDSVIFLQLEEIDATLLRVIPATLPGGGIFQIVGNAAAAATRVIAFMVVNVKAPS